MKKLITIENFQAENDIGLISLRKLIKRDDFPKILIGNKTLIINEAVTDWLIEHAGEELIR
mgnify:FL=1